MSAKCQLEVVGRADRTSSGQVEIEASEWPFPNSVSTAAAAFGESFRCAISAMIECPSWPQGSACPVSAHVQTITKAATLIDYASRASVGTLQDSRPLLHSLELCLNGIRRAQRKRRDGERGIGDCAGHEHAASEDIKIRMVDRPALPIDHAGFAFLAHARGTHDVAGAEEARFVQLALRIEREQPVCGRTEPLENVLVEAPHCLQSFAGVAGRIVVVIGQLRKRHAEYVLLVRESDAVAFVRQLFKSRTEHDLPVRVVSDFFLQPAS